MGADECAFALLEKPLDAKEQSGMLLSKSKFGEVPLYSVVEKGHGACAQALLEHARDPKEQSKTIFFKANWWETPLDKAWASVRPQCWGKDNCQLTWQHPGGGRRCDDAPRGKGNKEYTSSAGVGSCNTDTSFNVSGVRESQGVLDVPRYLPIEDFVKLVNPTKTVRTDFLED